jgi:hypothetical protein
MEKNVDPAAILSMWRTRSLERIPAWWKADGRATANPPMTEIEIPVFSSPSGFSCSFGIYFSQEFDVEIVLFHSQTNLASFHPLFAIEPP